LRSAEAMTLELEGGKKRRGGSEPKSADILAPTLPPVTMPTYAEAHDVLGCKCGVRGSALACPCRAALCIR
jgi:hypothetical protein